MPELHVSNPILHAEFQALAPINPLPWKVHPEKEWCIVDANGEEVCEANFGELADGQKIIGMILVAVNTCGGYGR